MRLYLVQHGDAVPERLDPERPLSAAGRQEVEAVAHGAKDCGCSTARPSSSRSSKEALAAAGTKERRPPAMRCVAAGEITMNHVMQKPPEFSRNSAKNLRSSKA
jgi:hypothetical protein